MCVDVYANFFLALYSCSVASGVRTLEISQGGGCLYHTHTHKIMSAVHKDLFVAYFQLLRFEKVTEV